MQPEAVSHKSPFSPAWLREKLASVGRRVAGSDRWLLAAVLVGILLGAQGFGWGRYDCLNLDRMAFQSVMSSERRPFEPDSYVKPPLYTYLNLLVARWPADNFARIIPGLSGPQRQQISFRGRVVLSRAFNLALFAGLVVMVFVAVREAYGRPAARMAAWILATSSGFIPYQVFLTTDLALVVFMMAAFLASLGILREPGMRISVIAGLLAGAATAVKYNGLAIAICLPLAHLLASRGNPILACLRRPAAWACGAAVPVGFVLGNPYSVIAFPKFWNDFLYNYIVTPVYNGAGEGTGYRAFLNSFPEIFGLPGSWFLAAMIVLGFGFVAVSVARKAEPAWKIWLLAAAVFAFYFWKIGGFPRVETRFVLPMAPFVLILAGAGLALFARVRFLALPVVAALVALNLASGWWIGELFRKDPRSLALAWAESNFQSGDIVETSGACPQWRWLPDRKLKIHRIPSGLERRQMFAQMFATDPAMLARISEFESPEDIGWFSPEARAERNSQWIAWSTIDLEGVSIPFFDGLFEPGSGYAVAFDASSPELPAWAYPRNTEFLRNRLVIWEKASASR